MCATTSDFSPSRVVNRFHSPRGPASQTARARGPNLRRRGPPWSCGITRRPSRASREATLLEFLRCDPYCETIRRGSTPTRGRSGPPSRAGCNCSCSPSAGPMTRVTLVRGFEPAQPARRRSNPQAPIRRAGQCANHFDARHRLLPPDRAGPSNPRRNSSRTACPPTIGRARPARWTRSIRGSTLRDPLQLCHSS